MPADVLISSRDVWLYPESKSERIAAESTVGGFVRCSEGQDIGESLPFCPSFFVFGGGREETRWEENFLEEVFPHTPFQEL
jgi:hypothetical protein